MASTVVNGLSYFKMFSIHVLNLNLTSCYLFLMVCEVHVLCYCVFNISIATSEYFWA